MWSAAAQRLPLWAVLLSCTTILSGHLFHAKELSFGHHTAHRSYNELADATLPGEVVGSKWVVVTTVNYPTETMKRLAAVPGWNVVVVADAKTPEDWFLENVTVLRMADQAELGYSIYPLLPQNHYGRKNIGYLYAIQHGATEVYETDDDNELKSPETLRLPTFEGMEYYVYNATGVCNPYEYFGLPHIWPRGYPLDQIRQSHCDTFTRRAANPLILQGLADLDPDVDAIFRLTQPMGVNFRADIPSVVLPEGVMCPWNSQNTLFSHDALWGLLIPVTTTFRVCDIWRSYWVQRLLWEVGGNLAFGAPTVDQYRNAHNLMRDFKDELPLYELAGGLVKLLNDWRAPAGADLPRLMIDVARSMADAKMWERGDADLMAAWVSDLKAIGYKFPKRIGSHDTPTGSAAASSRRQLLEGPSGTLQRAPAVVPRTPAQWHRYRNIVVVVVFNSPYEGWSRTYRLLKEAYTPIFGTVVFTGQLTRPEGMPESERWVPCECSTGALQHACYANAVQEYPAPADGGHLILADDTIISHCQLQHFNTSKIWFPRAVDAIKENVEECLAKKVAGEEYTYAFSTEWRAAMVRVLTGFMDGPLHNKFGERIRRKLGDNLQMAHFGGDPTDALYIPSRLSLDFVHALTPFLQEKIHHELAIPAVLGMIAHDTSDFQVFRPLYYWILACKGCREKMAEKPQNYLKPSRLAGNAFMLHPYKMGWRGLTDVFWDWWTGSACIGEAPLDSTWHGTAGIGICGPEAYKNEPEGQQFSNLYFDEQEHVVTHSTQG